MQIAQVRQIKQFGQAVKKLREEREYSQYYLADLCEIDRSSVQRIEAGQINPTLTTIISISVALEVPIEEIFSYVKIPKLDYIGLGKTPKTKAKKKKK
jgi:DNA-binding XRE family transcriptional regulator